jgi:uncharacterized protein
MFYESFRDRLEGKAIAGRRSGAIAWGLCLMALLLMGCRDRQAVMQPSPALAEPAASEVSGAGPSESEASGAGSAAIENAEDAGQAVADPQIGLMKNMAQVLPVTAQVTLGGEMIDLEVTRTLEEQATGLMYRQQLPDERGMLFRFSPARPVQFWMKNVVIDLDMVFVHEGKIVGIAADVTPCNSTPCATYSPGFGVLVDEVIELAGGRAAELGLAVGDAVVITPVQSKTP